MGAICEIYSRKPFAFQTELPLLRGSFTKEVPYVSRQSGMLDYMVKTRAHGTMTNLCHKFGKCFLRQYPWCPSPVHIVLIHFSPMRPRPTWPLRGQPAARPPGERARIGFGQRRLDGAAYSSIRPGHCLMDSAGRVVSECRPLALGHRPRTVPIGFVSP